VKEKLQKKGGERRFWLVGLLFSPPMQVFDESYYDSVVFFRTSYFVTNYIVTFVFLLARDMN